MIEEKLPLIKEELNDLLPDFSQFSEQFQQQILSLGSRSHTIEEMKEIIRNLCSFQPLTRKQLSKILGRTPSHLQGHYLTEMIKNKEIEYLYPGMPAHPKQAYRAPKANE